MRFKVEYAKIIICDGACRCVLAVGEAQERKALPDLQAGQQLVLHLPQPHLPVLGGHDQPLLRWVDGRPSQLFLCVFSVSAALESDALLIKNSWLHK